MKIQDMSSDEKSSIIEDEEMIDFDFSEKNVKKSNVDEILEDNIKRYFNEENLRKMTQAVNLSLPSIECFSYLINRVVNLVEVLQFERNINFLSNEVSKDREFNWCLLIVVKLSSVFNIEKSAANAISILNHARVCFSEMDLSYIEIPYADLRYALLDTVNLEGANLGHALVDGIYAANANLNNANLEKTLFSHYDLLSNIGEIRAVHYSQNIRCLFIVACRVTENNNQKLNFSFSQDSIEMGFINFEEKEWKWRSFEEPLFLSESVKDIQIDTSADGSILIVKYNGFLSDHQVTMYEIEKKETGLLAKKIFEFKRASPEFKGMALSNNNRYLVMGSFNYIDIFDRKTQKQHEKIFVTRDSLVTAITFSPHNQHFSLVTDNHNGPELLIYSYQSIQALEKRSLPFLRPLKSFSFSNLSDLNDVKFSPDGKYLVVLGCKIGGNSENVYYFDTKEWNKNGISVNSHDCNNICFAENSKQVFFRGSNGHDKLYAFSFEEESLIYSRTIKQDARYLIQGLACFSREEGLYSIVTANSNGEIKEWIISSSLLDTFKRDESEAEIEKACYLSSISMIAEVARSTLKKQDYLRLREVITGREVEKIPLAFHAECIAAHPLQSVLGLGGACSSPNYTSAEGRFEMNNGRATLLYRPKNEWLTYELEEKGFPVRSVAWSKDGNYFATGAGDICLYKIIYLANSLEIILLNKIRTNDQVWSLIFSFDQKYLLAGEGTVLLNIPLKDGKLEEPTTKNNDGGQGVMSLDISQDNQWILTANTKNPFGYEQGVGLWQSLSVFDFKLVWVFNAPEDEATWDVVFSPDNRWIVSCHKNGSLCFWAWPNEAQRQTFLSATLHEMPSLLYYENKELAGITQIFFDSHAYLYTLQDVRLTQWKVVEKETALELVMLWCSSLPEFSLRGAKLDRLALLSSLHFYAENKKRQAADQMNTSTRKRIKSTPEVSESFHQLQVISPYIENEIHEPENPWFIQDSEEENISEPENYNQQLFSAVCRNDSEKVQYLLEQYREKINLEYQSDGEGDGDPLLTHALSNGYFEIAKQLIVAGADVNHGNDGSVRYKFRVKTPLYCAISRLASNQESQCQQAVECVQFLLENQANPNLKEEGQIYPLEALRFYGFSNKDRGGRSFEILHLLIQYGANPKLLNQNNFNWMQKKLANSPKNISLAHHEIMNQNWSEHPDQKREALYNQKAINTCLKHHFPRFVFNMGVAQTGRDNLFDAIAQALNQLNSNDTMNVKSLRLICEAYIKELDQENSDHWVRRELLKQEVDYQDYLASIAFTQEEIEGKQQEQNENYQRNEIMPTPGIEGRIISERFNISLHLIMVQPDEADMELFQGIIDAQGLHSISEREINELDRVIHILRYRYGQHFVPLLKPQGPIKISDQSDLLPFIPEIKGLYYQPVPGDGHCLFHAVALYVGWDQQELRNLVSAHIEYDLKQFQEFITLLEGQSIEDYIKDIQLGKEWGANIEIEVLMRILDRPIVVISPDSKIINLQDSIRFRGKPIFVYYNNHNHYDVFLVQEGYRGQDILENLIQQSSDSKEKFPQTLNISSNSSTLFSQGHDEKIEEYFQGKQRNFL